MKIIYFYNEILPRRKAHDVYIVNECEAFAKNGADVTLVCGQGSENQEKLFSHYQTKTPFNVSFLPIIRKNNFLNLSWNFPFFFRSERLLEKKSPDVVICSVLKQGEYHFRRKLSKTLYVYEVHELHKTKEEQRMLSQADLIVTTTDSLTNMLKKPPFNIQVPVVTVHLAVKGESLPHPTSRTPFTFAYVGQLYKEQGLSLLLQALALTTGHLKVIGGKDHEIAHFKEEAKNLKIENRVEFLGFHPPSELASLLKGVHAFIAPFEAGGKMSYVAHTKLLEYARWERPIIAPDLNVVKECFPEGKGLLYFQEGNKASLAEAMERVQSGFEVYYEGIKAVSSHFGWDERANILLELFEKGKK